MTTEETLDAFVSLTNVLLDANKHVHLEPIQVKDTVLAIRDLQKENNLLKEEISNYDTIVKELSDKVLKMRCCYNCRNYNYSHEFCDKTKNDALISCDKWEFEPVC